MRSPLLFLFFLTLGSQLLQAQVKASYDYDKTVDFTQYQTFRFTEEALAYDMQELNRNRILNGIREQLQAKGMREAENADVLVNFYITAEQKQRQTANTNYYGAGGLYGYRWGAGFSTTTINVESYIAGTVFVDLIDAQSNHLVWQGRGSGTYQEDISPEKREKRIRKGLAKIFKNYPPERK